MEGLCDVVRPRRGSPREASFEMWISFQVTGDTGMRGKSTRSLQRWMVHRRVHDRVPCGRRKLTGSQNPWKTKSGGISQRGSLGSYSMFHALSCQPGLTGAFELPESNVSGFPLSVRSPREFERFRYYWKMARRYAAGGLFPIRRNPSKRCCLKSTMLAATFTWNEAINKLSMDRGTKVS